MRKILFSLVALFCATVCFAQGSMLATLKHDDTITTFYGSGALKEAYTAATHGDVITLSSGTFLATDIEKAITIRGAGMGVGANIEVEPTVITGDFTINIPDDVTAKFVLEGIYNNNVMSCGTLVNAVFTKCRLNKINQVYNTSGMKNATFLHCRIADILYVYYNSSVSCVNCAIERTSLGLGEDNSLECINCVVWGQTNQDNCSFKNCILMFADNGFSSISSRSSCYNSVSIGVDRFGAISNNTNKVADSYSEVFATYTGEDFDNLDYETFELTDEAKTKYLGMDGTQVGIYGGPLPFDPNPSNPQITKCEVASKSTADGKLSVSLEVMVAE